jgi:hypothetical protein
VAAAAGVRCGRAAAVVGDLKFELGCAVADDDASARRAGVLDVVKKVLMNSRDCSAETAQPRLLSRDLTAGTRQPGLDSRR